MNEAISVAVPYRHLLLTKVIMMEDIKISVLGENYSN